jgi:hypothetical protein
MKFLLACGVALALLGASLSASPQSPSTATLATPIQQSEPAHAPHGKVIFSRSIDQGGEAATQAGPASGMPALPATSAPAIDNAEREAVTVTAMDLDVHLHSADRQLAVRALVTVRNDSSRALTRIPLQISSALTWERLRVEGKDVSASIATLNSDTDHTGQLHEAEISLAVPLAPGQSLGIDCTYGGAITVSGQRLVALGTPHDVAIRSDWDEISVPFTGLRGFGNVVWYPVSSVPVLLGDGARLFNEVGAHKLRLSAAHLRVQLTIEFPYDEPPTVAAIDGASIPLTIVSNGGFGPASDGIATASFQTDQIGFEEPSLFVARRTAHGGPDFTAWTLPDNEVAIQAWSSAATTVTPFLTDWLGQVPRSKLTLLDLPDPDDAPFESGSLLVASLHETSADDLQSILVHALTHAWMPSPRAWVREGVATFMGTLWVEKLHGRNEALGVLEASRSALALEEPASPGESPGQPLAQAIAPIYYRTKAAYIFWMLRDLIGDTALRGVLHNYQPKQDTNLGPGAQPPAGEMEALLRDAAKASGKDLTWFFADWIDADKGLPDLSIGNVFYEPAHAGTWLVAINLANAGYVGVEVPVTAHTGKATVTDRVFIPGRGSITHRLLLMSVPTQIQLNDGVVPEDQASVHIKDIDQRPTVTTPQLPSPTPPLVPPPIPSPVQPMRP